MTDTRPWSIPGYVADQLVGDGPLGEVWTGRDLLDGTAVTLECGPPVPPATLTALRTYGRSGSRHPHLTSARDVVGERDRTVVVRDRPAGGSLATLLTHRGGLRPGELLTVIAPVASALDHLHARGVVHAAVVPERIVFDVDGRPALAGTVVDRLLGAPGRVPPELQDPALAAGAEPTAATDVFMLASCGLLALDGRHDVPEALLDALIAGADPDPAGRPTAAELAAAVGGSCPAEAVRLLLPAEEPEPAGWAPSVPPEWRTAAGTRPAPPVRDPADVTPAVEVGQHRRRARAGSHGRRAAFAVLAAVLLIVAGAVWFRSPRAEPLPVAAPPPSTAPADERWLRVVDGLDAVRAVAYERGDVGLLARVWAPGGRLQADTAQLRALVGTGCTARGVRHRFEGAVVLTADRTRVRLRVTQWLPSSQRVRASQVVGTFAGSPPATVAMDIVATDGGWRLS